MTNRLCVPLALFAIVFGLIPVPTARAADQVVTNTNDSGPGSLRQALVDVHSGGTVTFDLAPYPKTITVDGDLIITKSITIQGPGEDDLVIDGNDKGRLFFVNSGIVATISNLTITNGRETGSPAAGGCIYNDGTLNLDRVVVSSCEAIGDPASSSLM